MSTVGYICSNHRSEGVCAIQRTMIARYCQVHNITCEKFYCDMASNKRTADNVKKIQLLGYAHAYRLEKYFPEYEQMLHDIVEAGIKLILVDTRGRLPANKHQKVFFEKLCTQYNVKIIEVCGHLEEQTVDGKKKAALYRVTNKSLEKPGIYISGIDKLYEVSQQYGWETPFLFQDFSLLKSEQICYQEFKAHSDKYDLLVVTDFYHIEDKLGVFVSEIQELEAKGVKVESIKEGRVRISDDYLKQPLKVAIYDRWLDENDEGLELERLKAFVKYKTDWEIACIYKESEKVETDSKQQELQKLISESYKYDAILVRKFNCLHWRTSMFFKIARKMNIPIYSMKEGGIYLEQGHLQGSLLW